jgi:serine/threonine protein kinase
MNWVSFISAATPCQRNLRYVWSEMPKTKRTDRPKKQIRNWVPPSANWTPGHVRKKKGSRSADYPQPGDTILGWRSRKQQLKLAKSVVGTSQYMIPEVIRGDPYDGRCDWWSIGIVWYECLYGYTPFVCDNRQDIKMRILRYRQYLEKVKYKRSGKEF